MQSDRSFVFNFFTANLMASNSAWQVTSFLFLAASMPSLIISSSCVITAPTGASAVTGPNAQSNVAQKPSRFDLISFTSLSISPTNLTIGGGTVAGTQATWSATIYNPQKRALNNVVRQTWFAIYNPSGTLLVRRAAGGSLIACVGYSYGVLPGGTCSTSGFATPSNNGAGGLLVPDDNTHDTRFEVELIQNQGTPTQKLLAKTSTDVTLFYQLQ